MHIQGSIQAPVLVAPVVLIPSISDLHIPRVLSSSTWLSSLAEAIKSAQYDVIISHFSSLAKKRRDEKKVAVNPNIKARSTWCTLS